MGIARAGVALRDGDNLAIAGQRTLGIANAGNVIWRAETAVETRNFITVPGDPGIMISQDGYHVGGTFNVGARPVTVYELGRFWHPQDVAANPVQVFLMTATGTTGTVIATATVAYGGARDQFAYGSITPITLSAGTRYAIVQDWQNSAGQYPAYGHPENTQISADFNTVQRVWFWPITGTFSSTSMYNSVLFGPLDFRYVLQ